METDQIVHGTYGGYQQCRKRPEGSCPDCRATHRAYIKEWRRNNAALQSRLVENQQARDKALRRLARMFPGQFQELYDEELAKLPARPPVWGGAG